MLARSRPPRRGGEINMIETNDAWLPPAGRKYLFVEDLVRITGIPATTWQKWRSLKKGPRYRKLGRRAVYDPKDMRAWDEAQIVITE